MGIFDRKKLNPEEEAFYTKGWDDAEIKITAEFNKKLTDLENDKDEIIAALQLEVNRRDIQIKNLKKEFGNIQQEKILIRKEKSIIKREFNKINKFKEEMSDSLQIRLSEVAENFQEILSFMAETKFEPEKIENLAK